MRDKQQIYHSLAPLEALATRLIKHLGFINMLSAPVILNMFLLAYAQNEPNIQLPLVSEIPPPSQTVTNLQGIPEFFDSQVLTMTIGKNITIEIPIERITAIQLQEPSQNQQETVQATVQVRYDTNIKIVERDPISDAARVCNPDPRPQAPMLCGGNMCKNSPCYPVVRHLFLACCDNNRSCKHPIRERRPCVP